MYSDTDILPAKHEDLTALIGELNTQLLDESASSAARAFNLGCLLSGLFVGSAVTVVWLLHHWVSAVLTLLITASIAVGVSTLLAMRARYHNMTQIFQEEVKPRLQHRLQQGDISSQEWERILDETLSAEDSLKLLLSKYPLEGRQNG
jgi:hypothetical protein